MYTYISAMCLAMGSAQKWVQTDISGTSVNLVYSKYVKVYLTVQSDVLQESGGDGLMYVDMDQFRGDYSAYAGTVAQLLVEIGSLTLETVPSLPSSDVKYALYSDARQADFQVDLARAGYYDPVNYPGSDMDDLTIVKRGGTVAGETLGKYCLFTVNGFVHRSTYAGGRLYILDGAKSGRISEHNSVGVQSFYNLGEITQHEIDANTVLPKDPETPIGDKLTFTLPADVTGKSFFLVLGGYIVPVEDRVFYEDGSGHVTLHLNKIPLLDRLFESKDFIDLSSLELPTVETSETAIHEPSVFTQETVRKLFSLSQSFLVVVDIPHLTMSKISIRHRSYPTAFTTIEEPTQALLVGHGRLAEYWKTDMRDHWIINTDDSYLRNYIAPYIRGVQRGFINDNLHPQVQSFDRHGYLLTISGYRTI